MSNQRKVVRTVARSTVYDFDEQLWPINCMLLILAGCLSGIVLATSTFEDPRLARDWAEILNNGYVRLTSVAMTVAVLLLGTWYLGSRLATRRMQLAVLFALVLHFWMILWFYVIPVALSQYEDPANNLADDTEQVTLPDYGRDVHHQQSNEQLTQPVETVTPDQQRDEQRTSQPTEVTPERTETQEPARSEQRPSMAELQRAATAVPRRSEDPSNVRIARSEASRRTNPTEDAIPTPTIRERASQRADVPQARSTAMNRSQESPAQSQRVTPSQISPLQPSETAASIQRQATPEELQINAPQSQLVRGQTAAPRVDVQQPSEVVPNAAATEAAVSTELAPTTDLEVARTRRTAVADLSARQNPDTAAGSTGPATPRVTPGTAPQRAASQSEAVGMLAPGQSASPTRARAGVRLGGLTAAEPAPSTTPGPAGGGGQPGGVNAPRGTAVARATGGAAAPVRRSTTGAGGEGTTDSPIASTPGPVGITAPQRATVGSGTGPQLTAATPAGPGLVRRSATPGLPTGADLADDVGPTSGDPSAMAGDPGGRPGPSTEEVTRSDTNDLTVRVAGPTGQGGLRPGPTVNPGIPNRLARADSDVVNTEVDRFDLRKTTRRITLDAEVRAAPAEAFRQRDPTMREDLAKDRGGSSKSEAAVEAGLDFLARHQMPDGRWSLHLFAQGRGYGSEAGVATMQSDTAGTGMALLAFLGAGYTHQRDKYREVVGGGLRFLIENQKSDGDLFSGGSKYCWLYSHGMAAIALCEAYGMTRDPALREPAQKAVDFIVAAQHPELGGWRYAPQTGTDTSVSGWQVMALKAGQLAGLDVPDEAFEGVRRWLDGAHAEGDEGLYVYRPTANQEHQRNPSGAMTAEALLMRLYLGWDREHPSVQRGAKYLQERLPSFGTPQRNRRDAYYWYYATQTLFLVKGPSWQAWNEQLRPLLTDSQETVGPLTGSWDPSGPTQDRWGPAAGRIYVTCMHLLMLEVYYRHLPLYRLGEEPTDKVSGP